MKNRMLLMAAAALAAGSPVSYRDPKQVVAGTDAQNVGEALERLRSNKPAPPPEPVTLTLRNYSSGIMDCVGAAAGMMPRRAGRGHTNNSKRSNVSFCDRAAKAATMFELDELRALASTVAMNTGTLRAFQKACDERRKELEGA